jgi:hypothetical protein
MVHDPLIAEYCPLSEMYPAQLNAVVPLSACAEPASWAVADFGTDTAASTRKKKNSYAESYLLHTSLLPHLRDIYFPENDARS